MNIWLLYLLLLRATLTSFSGFASLPVLRDDLVVRRGVLTDDQLNAALAIGQASPGPLGLYIVGAGYFVGGLPGAIAGIAALATPALLAIPLLQLIQRRAGRPIQGAIAGIVLASCVLMLVAAARLSSSAVTSVPLATLAGIALMALTIWRIPPLIVVLFTAVAGLIVQFF